MKLTTKGNYAIASLLDLAVHSNGGHINLHEIAERLALSENYLRQLFMELRKKGIVDSVRGVGGGYYLAQEPSFIKILDVIEAVEGDIYVVPCLDDECDEGCYRETICGVKPLWAVLNESVREKLSSLTLQELIDEYYMEEGAD